MEDTSSIADMVQIFCFTYTGTRYVVPVSIMVTVPYKDLLQEIPDLDLPIGMKHYISDDIVLNKLGKQPGKVASILRLVRKLDTEIDYLNYSDMEPKTGRSEPIGNIIMQIYLSY